MTATVSPEDVFDYLAKTPTDAQMTAASIIIDGLEAQIRSYIRRPLQPTMFVEDERTIRIGSDGKWRPRNLPLLSVENVTFDGSALVVISDFVFDSGSISLGPRWVETASVRYVAGLDGDDGESDFGQLLRTRIIAKAAEVVNKVVREDQAGLSEMDIEGTRYRWSTKDGFAREELEADFMIWRRRTVR